MGGCDLIISLEPMEALRYLPYLKKDGWIVTNTAPFLNIPNYPEMEKIWAELARLPHVISLDADAIAKEIRSPRSANMVLLGAAASVLKGLSKQSLEDGIRAVFARKGDAIVESNLTAFQAGYTHAKQLTI